MSAALVFAGTILGLLFGIRRLNRERFYGGPVVVNQDIDTTCDDDRVIDRDDACDEVDACYDDQDDAETSYSSDDWQDNTSASSDDRDE